MPEREMWCEIHLSAATNSRCTLNIDAESGVQMIAGVQMIIVDVARRLGKDPDWLMETLYRAIHNVEFKDAWEMILKENASDE